MKKKVVITGKDENQFEVEFRRFSRRVIITCVKIKGLNFLGAIEEFVKELDLQSVDDGMMEISYRCKNRKEFERICKKLKRP